MREKSEFEITCECGHAFTSHERETKCPKCGVVILIRWNESAADDMPDPVGHLFVEQFDSDTGESYPIVTLRIAKGASEADAKLVSDEWQKAVLMEIKEVKEK